VDNFVHYGSRDLGDFRLGQFKTPVGWEEGGISASATTFLERSLPVQAVNMGRRIGVDWAYSWNPQWLTTLGYYNGGDLNGDNDGTGASAHVVFNPVKDNGEVVHLGLAVSRENRYATTDSRDIVSVPTARFRARPEANLTNVRLVDSGNLKNADNIDRAGLEAAWIRGPLLLQGEYLQFKADFTDAKPDYSGGGYYVSGAWMLTGERREYANAAVGNVKPAHAYGALEIATRYSELDLNDTPVLGGKAHDWTIGANWYIGRHLKFQADYVRAYSNKYNGVLKRDLEIDPEVFELRAQIYF
jgi:phosphate-selective porin OprO/OprP